MCTLQLIKAINNVYFLGSFSKKKIKSIYFIPFICFFWHKILNTLLNMHVKLGHIMTNTMVLTFKLLSLPCIFKI